MKLSNKAYDILKTICLVILPAAAALVTACGALWGLSDTMIKAIAGTITGLGTVLGGVLGLSSSIYYDDQIPKPEPAPEPAVEEIEDRESMVAAISAAIATVMGEDVSGIRILSITRID